ncbi:MAG: hypothetical protein ISS35_02350 [Kiritimatiellae bacterium]|nr:hypothetical protein [Kiritimatiellia bacterium]
MRKRFGSMRSVRFCLCDFVRLVSVMAAGLLLTGIVLLSSGCSTTDEDSDLPWNTQQTWEGGVAIPGFNRGGDGF